MKHPTPHSKEQLTTPTRAKGTSTIGPAHDGGAKQGFLAAPGEPGLAAHHVSHGQAALQSGADIHGDRNNIARNGKAKAVHGVSTHSGMTEAQHFSAGGGGLGHATSTAIPGLNPLSPNAVTFGRQKAFATQLTKIKPGMRSRTLPLSDDEHARIGAAILDQATRIR